MRKLLIVILSLFTCTVVSAQVSASSRMNHEVNIGIGDMMFETVLWHNQPHKDYRALPYGAQSFEKTGYSYTPHFSVQYFYSPKRWLSVGGDMNFQYTSWDKEWYDNLDRLTSSSDERFFNLCIMPCVRFNYMNNRYVNLYSSIAAGMDINGGSETDCFGRHTLVGIAADLRLIGVRAGDGNYWGFADIGCLAAMKNTDTLFMVGSQIFRIGFSYRFEYRKEK